MAEDRQYVLIDVVEERSRSVVRAPLMQDTAIQAGILAVAVILTQSR